MPASLWSDSGTWIALGISALFVVVGLAMHHVIRKVLQAPPPDLPGSPGQTSSSAAVQAADSRTDTQENRTP